MKTHTPQPLDPDVDDSFRLMELHPGQGEEPITLRLVDSHVKTAPPYESLSYTWGDASHQVPVRVFYGGDNHESHETAKIKITFNCHAAVKRLRRPDTPRMLWVDSICINQSIVPERNRQLGLMTNIYQNAAQVLIYLGESHDDSDSVMSWIRELDSPSHFGDGNSSTPPSKETLQKFLQRPWFHRVWILQEAAFAKQAIVICGSQETDWKGFISFYHWNTSRRRDGLSLPYSLLYSASEPFHIWESIPSTCYAKALRRMLQASRLSLATNPRDKIYAVLPLVKAEYEKSMQTFSFRLRLRRIQARQPSPKKYPPASKSTTHGLSARFSSMWQPSCSTNSALTNFSTWSFLVHKPYPIFPHGYLIGQTGQPLLGRCNGSWVVSNTPAIPSPQRRTAGRITATFPRLSRKVGQFLISRLAVTPTQEQKPALA